MGNMLLAEEERHLPSTRFSEKSARLRAKDNDEGKAHKYHFPIYNPPFPNEELPSPYPVALLMILI
jgi:hypothetical protein